MENSALKTKNTKRNLCCKSFEKQVETVIKIVKKVLKLKELPEIFIVDEFPKPFKGMKWVMLHVSPSSEKVYGIKRCVYVKKNLIIPYYSSITLIQNAYFFIYKKYGIKGLLNLAQKGWKGIYEWERKRFELKKGLFDRTLENIIDEILYFSPFNTCSPEAFIIAKNCREGIKVSQLCKKLRMKRDVVEKAPGRITKRNRYR